MRDDGAVGPRSLFPARGMDEVADGFKGAHGSGLGSSGSLVIVCLEHREERGLGDDDIAHLFHSLLA
ncbi:MAG: hypothetical protein P8182_20265, partial [Deltaproteobacteria bacterium]